MLNTHKVGLVFGTVFGGAHVLWALFVLLGWAQPIVDFVFWAHMMEFPPMVAPFDLIASAALIVIASIIGYIAGYVASSVWNKIHSVA
ncbi:MAG: hypothetical protein Q7K40_00725 [bacterium]|nr:hypothetical protein [bacterium]